MNFKNFSISTVDAAPSPATSGTTLDVPTGEGVRFPPTPFMAGIGPEPSSSEPFFTPDNAEIVKVTDVTGDTLTIVRAQEGTTARTVVVGDVIAATVTAGMLAQLDAAATLFTYMTAR